jgi:hypothetical protein
MRVMRLRAYHQSGAMMEVFTLQLPNLARHLLSPLWVSESILHVILDMFMR